MSLPLRTLLPTDINRRRFGTGTPQRVRWDAAPVRSGRKRMARVQGSRRPSLTNSTSPSSPRRPKPVTRQRSGPYLNCYVNADLKDGLDRLRAAAGVPITKLLARAIGLLAEHGVVMPTRRSRSVKHLQARISAEDKATLDTMKRALFRTTLTTLAESAITHLLRDEWTRTMLDSQILGRRERRDCI